MVPVTTLRPGSTFEENGDIFQVLTYEHLHLRKTSAVVKIRARNLRSGEVVEKSFISNSKVNPVTLTKRQLQFLYRDSKTTYSMDPQTFEQVSLPLKMLIGHEYLKEGEKFSISFLEDEPLILNLPPKMDYKVIETGPGLRGNSATNIFKDAVLENGLKTKVPLFINVNDLVRIDTRTGAYTEKA